MNIQPAKAARRFGVVGFNPKAHLKDQFHEVARFNYLSGRTESTYWQWVVRFLKFHRFLNRRDAEALSGRAARTE